ncbi:MAG: hypothetical protein JSR47_22620 [Proteobacteria bacterium]|nr:hypothetical protein [Pseudomonadota bacterium]MBS0550018.1 hypothetical protein [Pseudomonadota bacterium]
MVVCMGIFSSPQLPYAPPLPAAPPPPPTPVDKAAEDAAKQTQARLAASSGFGNTLLTGGQGVSAPASTTLKTLLGQ